MYKSNLRNTEQARAAMDSWPEWKKNYRLTKNSTVTEVHSEATIQQQPIVRVCKK